MEQTKAEALLTKYLLTLKTKNQLDGHHMHERLLPIFEKYVVVDSQGKQTLYKTILPSFIENDIQGDLLARYEQIRSTRGTTLKRLCLIYGDIVGSQKFKSYCDVQALTNTFEYKRDKYGWTQEQFDEYNASRSCTIDNLVKRHGKELGTKKWNEYVERQRYAGCKLDYFIEKYGKELGTTKYAELNLAKSHSLASFEKKFPDKEQALQEYISYMDRPTNAGGYSLNSQQFFEQICNEIDVDVGTIYYKTLNKEFGKYDNLYNRYYYYDFTIPDLKLIVEYNGDLYHGNPALYEGNDIPPFRGNTKTAAQLWEYDAIKQGHAKTLGFDVIVVWESEYLKDQVLTVNRVINEIHTRRKNNQLSS